MILPHINFEPKKKNVNQLMTIKDDFHLSIFSKWNVGDVITFKQLIKILTFVFVYIYSFAK